MPDETINNLTDRLNRTLTMTQPTLQTTGSSTGFTTLQMEQISLMIKEALQISSDHLADEGADRPIGTVTARLEELDKVPDIVRSLREFSGRPGEFNSWRKSVERVLKLYDSVKGTGRYYAILHTIRTKIVGDADTALESYRTPLDWSRIKKCLSMHYSDKRDIGTLEYQMMTLCQGNRSITEFYQAVYQHLSLLLDKVSSLDLEESSLHAMTNTYREKALDTFVRGLNGDLPKLLSVREPTSLPQALHICLKLDNMTFRRNYAHGQSIRNNVQKDKIGAATFTNGRIFYPELAYVGGTPSLRPPLPPRRNMIPNFNRNPNNHLNFYPTLKRNQNLNHNPNFHPNVNPNLNSNISFNHNRNVPENFRRNSAFTNNLQNRRPEPMDVDNSIQTRQVDYMNRPPNNLAVKRPATSFQIPASKFQRNFHINADCMPKETFYDYYRPEDGNMSHHNQNVDFEYDADYFHQIPEEVTTLEKKEEETDDVQLAVNFLD